MRIGFAVCGALLLTACNPDGGGFGIGPGNGSEGPGGEAGDRDRPDRLLDGPSQGRADREQRGEDARARAAWERASDGALVAQVSGTREHRDVWGVVRLRPAGDGVEVEARVDGLPAGTHGYHVHQYGDCSAPEEDSMGDHVKFDQLLPDAARTGTGRQPSREATGIRPGAVPGQPEEGQDARKVGEEGTPGGTTGGAGGEPAAERPELVAGQPGQPTGQAPTEPPAEGAPGEDAAQPPGPGAETTPSATVDGNLGELVVRDGSAEARAIVPNLKPEDLPALVGLAVVIHERGNVEDTPSGDAGTPIACGVIGIGRADADIIPADVREDDVEPRPEEAAPARPDRPAGQG